MPSNDQVVIAARILAAHRCPTCHTAIYTWDGALAHAEGTGGCQTLFPDTDTAAYRAAHAEWAKQNDHCSECKGIGLAFSPPTVHVCSGCGGVGTRQAELCYGGM